MERERAAHLGHRPAADRAGRGAGPGAERAPRPRDFGLILSSPRRRARVTAELAGFTGAYEPQLDEDLAEWAYGDYEGRTSDEIDETVPGWTIWTAPGPRRRDGRRGRRPARPGGRPGARLRRRAGHLLRPRPRAAGAGDALARLRPEPRRALPARHQHRLGARRGEGSARARALERPRPETERPVRHLPTGRRSSV